MSPNSYLVEGLYVKARQSGRTVYLLYQVANVTAYFPEACTAAGYEVI